MKGRGAAGASTVKAIRREKIGVDAMMDHPDGCGTLS